MSTTRRHKLTRSAVEDNSSATTISLPDTFYDQFDHSIRPFYVKENIGQLVKARQDRTDHLGTKFLFLGKIKGFLRDVIAETKSHEAQGRGGRSVAHAVYTVAEWLRTDKDLCTYMPDDMNDDESQTS